MIPISFSKKTNCKPAYKGTLEGNIFPWFEIVNYVSLAPSYSIIKVNPVVKRPHVSVFRLKVAEKVPPLPLPVIVHQWWRFPVIIKCPYYGVEWEEGLGSTNPKKYCHGKQESFATHWETQTLYWKS